MVKKFNLRCEHEIQIQPKIASRESGLAAPKRSEGGFLLASRAKF
jgi:hypothetical protein